MNQGMEKGRVCSGSPDTYEQFYVHRCDAECFVTSVFYTFVGLCATVVSLRFLSEAFNYRTCPWVRSMTDAERKWLVGLGRRIYSYPPVNKTVKTCMTQMSRYIALVARVRPNLKPITRIVAARNTLENWGMGLAAVAIYMIYLVIRVIVTGLHYYLQERKMLYFCTNMVTPRSFDSGAYTEKMLERLYSLPEYRRLKQQRMTSGPEAWNWQTRQRMGEPMPSDDMSDEKM